MCLLFQSWTGALHKYELKRSEYCPYRHHEYTYRKFWIITKHIQNKNSFIIIRKDAFLSKEASNEEMASQDF